MTRSEIRLYDHQRAVLNKLDTGSILCGGVGTGKSITSLAYYYTVECGGTIGKTIKDRTNMKHPKDLYIITTARKRDTLEWDKECLNFGISRKQELNIQGNKLFIDSWNNIGKYTDTTNAFFIFDEQKLVGYGAWVKSFLKIAKRNNWILLSATPGDTWSDYIPVLIANGYYKNKTDFARQHIVYNNYVQYPLIQRYINTSVLEKYRKKMVVMMYYKRHTKQHHKHIYTNFDSENTKVVMEKRWNPFTNEPIEGISELCYLTRQIANSDPSRVEALKQLILKNDRIIVFYNFNYELDIIKTLCSSMGVDHAEWNGHKHENIPPSDRWVYIIQYTSGAEGWNCTDTDTIVFYSQNYSYKVMIQAAGRIDRLNTEYVDLYYYHLKSRSPIDYAISKALTNKKVFNEKIFVQNPSRQ